MGPANWIPTGIESESPRLAAAANSPSKPLVIPASTPVPLVWPAGTLSDGMRAKFTNVVNKSLRYISSGSSTFWPSLKAGVGHVGQRTKS